MSEDNPLANLPQIAPSIKLDEAPRALLPAQLGHRSGFKGRLLTPADGCGVSKSGVTSVVGVKETKPGKHAL